MKVLLCLLVTNWIVSINTKENKVNGAKFAIENDKRIAVTENYTHAFCTTKVMCSSETKCCDASYNCCVTIETFDRWEVIKKDKYGKMIYVLCYFQATQKS